MTSREAEITLARHVLPGPRGRHAATGRAGEGPGQRQAAPHPPPRPAERRELARAMLEDVLDAAVAALPGASSWSPPIRRSRPSPAPGVECLAESANRGHTAAVAFAQREAVTRGEARFLTLPGDVPCVTAQEIATLCGALEERPVVFVPSRSGRGTNAALLAPPDAIPLTFGEPSFENHLKTARAAGLTPACSSCPASASTWTRPTICPCSSRGARHPERRSSRLPGGRAALQPEPCAAPRALRGHRRRRPPRVPARGRPGGPDRGRGAPSGHADRRPGPPGDQPEDRLQGRRPPRAALRRDALRAGPGGRAGDRARPDAPEVILGESRRIVRRPRACSSWRRITASSARTRAWTSPTWTRTPRACCPRTPTAPRSRSASGCRRSPATSWP